MKTRFALLVSPFLLLFALACSDNPAASKLGVPRGASFSIPLSGDLNQDILNILTLLPKGLETAATTRWGNVKAKYVAGLSDPAQMAVAKQMLFELSAWVNMKAPNMDPPPFGESRNSAASRAVLYMAMYIYNGQTTSPPDGYFSGADAVVGLVTPGAAATVVTPTGHAGVAFDAGSVAENTIIVISQNLTPYPQNCSGPLVTKLCQYPHFYNFEQFPHTKLLKGAKFSVCHVNGGTNRAPLADHERFRLAHAKPANSADYTPGSKVRDEPGVESIEILPLIRGLTFVTCPPGGILYASAAGASDGLLSRLARGVTSAFTPKSAYAIDQGGGGVSFFFSPFNDVDSLGRPDRAVQTLTATPVCGPIDCLAHPGTALTLNFTVANTGTAATGDGPPGPPAAGVISLVQPAIEGSPTVFPLGTFGVGQIVPGGSLLFSQVVVIPNTVPAGDYSVQVTVGEGAFPEDPANLTNNTSSVPLNVNVDLNGLFTGAISDLAIAYHGNGLTPMAEGQVTFSALFTDEFLNAETSASRIAIDRRSILSNNVSVRNSFRDIQRARATLDFASMRWGQNLNISPGHGILLAYRGFADVLLAENWCSGVPTSVLSATGVVVYGTQQTTTQLLQSAVLKFDSAIAIGSALGESGTTDLITARIGKARALLDLNDVAGAASTAATVPTAFSTGLGPSATENNGTYEFQNVQHLWTVSDNEGVNGLFYRSDEDSRIDFESVGTGPDDVTPVFAQLKYPNAAFGTALAEGVEARLIEAESFLASGQLANFTVQINMVRVFYGLSPLTAPVSAAAARETLFRERAYSLWLTSHRLGDLRRLVRQYGQGQSDVFPTGEYPKGGVYGSDVNFPIPVDATFNPAGLACFDRNP
jgi:hypothetical protein